VKDVVSPLMACRRMRQANVLKPETDEATAYNMELVGYAPLLPEGIAMLTNGGTFVEIGLFFRAPQEGSCDRT
jgi:hypothetical protein